MVRKWRIYVTWNENLPVVLQKMELPRKLCILLILIFLTICILLEECRSRFLQDFVTPGIMSVDPKVAHPARHDNYRSVQHDTMKGIWYGKLIVAFVMSKNVTFSTF